MREIKFRAWDPHNKEFTYSEGIKRNGNYRSDLCFFFDLFRGMDLGVLMQFTGLKDKNGTPIYEGDLLSNDAGAPVMEVVFSNGCFTLNGLECLINKDLDHTKFLQVIGNIYEDKGKQEQS